MIDQSDREARNLRGIFPGVFTMGNLFCGFLSILSSMDGEWRHACQFILLGFFLDGLDGIVARVSKGVTRFGVELDSLADLITFGLAPAIMVYSFRLKDLGKWGWVLGFVFVMCGAFRLARYNLNAKSGPRQGFEGLPIPAAASLLVAYTLFSFEMWGELKYVRFLVAMTLVTSGLMVSTIPFEDKPTSWRTTKDKLKFLYLFVGAIAVLVDMSMSAFPLILGYIAYGLGREIVETVTNGGSMDHPIRLPRRRRKIEHKEPWE